MRIAHALCGAALAVIASYSAAAATTLSGDLTSDNQFVAYLSTNDSVLGTQISSGSNWLVDVTFSGAGLTGGVTNYLHVIAQNSGGPDMFIGSFSLSDSGFHFVNGTQSLVTNVTDWHAAAAVFSDPWSAPSGTPQSFGPNGTGPWGTFSGMGAAAFIWSNPNNGDTAFFSTAIVSNVAATPIPAALPLFLSAIGGLGLLARRKRRASAV